MKIGDDETFLEIIMHAPAWMVYAAVGLATLAVLGQLLIFVL